MKTAPVAVLHVQDGVYTVKEDNGCKHLRNGNEINAVSLPENTCIFVHRHVTSLNRKGFKVLIERLKSLSPETDEAQLLSSQF